MTAKTEIRESRASDLDTLERLYPAAFPDEDLLPLVRELLRDGESSLSLVATLDGRIVGHVIFTRCGLTGSDDSASLLGPLGVDPAHQGVGIGTALVRDGLARAGRAGALVTLVLGDPAYYSRFGFRAESEVEPPYELPAEWDGAWQSIWTAPCLDPMESKLVVPEAWMQPALWQS